MASALNTRIERIPGERKHSVEFLALVDERVIAVCTTRDEAQDALNAYRFDSFRREHAPMSTEPFCQQANAAADLGADTGADFVRIWVRIRVRISCGFRAVASLIHPTRKP